MTPLSVDDGSLDQWAADLRRLDRDRFLCLLCADAAARPGLFALYAFNLEIARIPDLVSEPVLGQMRLQWWREQLPSILAGEPQRQPLAQALADLAAAGVIRRGELETYLDAREGDLFEDPPADLAALEAYLMDTNGIIAAWAVRHLWGEESGLGWLSAVTKATGLLGVIRSLPFKGAMRLARLPADSGLDADALMARDVTEPLRSAVKSLSLRAGELLDEARKDTKAPRALRPLALRPLALPAVFGRHHLARLEQADFDPYDPRLARQSGPGALLRMIWANRTGRL
ncbi:MAG: phytoene/squalene synthase family protein [Rhodospirillales bacterium]